MYEAVFSYEDFSHGQRRRPRTWFSVAPAAPGTTSRMSPGSRWSRPSMSRRSGTMRKRGKHFWNGRLPPRLWRRFRSSTGLASRRSCWIVRQKGFGPPQGAVPGRVAEVMLHKRQRLIASSPVATRNSVCASGGNANRQRCGWQPETSKQLRCDPLRHQATWTDASQIVVAPVPSHAAGSNVSNASLSGPPTGRTVEAAMRKSRCELRDNLVEISRREQQREGVDRSYAPHEKGAIRLGRLTCHWFVTSGD